MRSRASIWHDAITQSAITGWLFGCALRLFSWACFITRRNLPMNVLLYLMRVPTSAVLQWYQEAHKLNPEYSAPDFGLGQMQLVNDEPKKAAECFERVLKAQPANVDALKAVAYLHKARAKWLRRSVQ